MGKIFIDMVKNVGIFMVVAQTLLHFGVGKRYEKYLKLIISLMVVSLLVSGFGALLKSEKELGITKIWKMGQSEYYEFWQKNRKNFEEKVVLKQKEIEKHLENDIIGQDVKEEKQKHEKEQPAAKIKIDTIKIE